MKKYRVSYNVNAAHKFQEASWQTVASVEAKNKKQAEQLVYAAFQGKDNDANIDLRFSGDVTRSTRLRAEIDKE